MVGIFVPNMRAERDTEEEIIKIFDQQAGIRTARLSFDFRKLLIRIGSKKLTGQVINSNIVIHRSTLPLTKNAGRGEPPSPPDGFIRSVFCLPLRRNRHATSSLGQFFVYRRVRTVTRLIETIPAVIIIAREGNYVNRILYMVQGFALGKKKKTRRRTSGSY